MKITSRVGDNQEQAGNEYPCAKITTDGLLVLFNKPGNGMVLRSDNNWKIGEYITLWEEKNFKPWYGTITLEVTK